jgi:hypothetical protein
VPVLSTMSPVPYAGHVLDVVSDYLDFHLTEEQVSQSALRLSYADGYRRAQEKYLECFHLIPIVQACLSAGSTRRALSRKPDADDATSLNSSKAVILATEWIQAQPCETLRTTAFVFD